MRIPSFATALIIASISLASCGTAEESTTQPSAAETSESESDAAEDETAEDTTSADEDDVAEPSSDDESAEESDQAEEADSDTGGSAFGDRVEVTDTMAVTVQEPEKFEPTYTDFMMEEWDTYIKMDVVLENTGDEPMEAMSFNARATSGSREAEEIFDTEAGIDIPTAVIQPGRELEFTIGYGVSAGEPFDLTIEDWTDFDGESVTLSTTVE